MKLTFKGGIHPYEGKELTMDKDVIEYVPKGDMVYPLSQHIGAPAKAVVKKGDRVLVGQLIAEAGGFVSANIHSSVSGTVKAVEPRLTASGSKVNSIVIENDNQFEEIEYVKNDKPLAELNREEILEAIKNAGVAMPAFIGAAYFRNVVFLGIVAKDLERAHVRAHAATNAFGPVDDWGHIRFLLSKTVFSEVGVS